MARGKKSPSRPASEERNDDRPAAELPAAHIHYAALGVISFGLATGVAFAIFVFLLGLVAGFTGWGAELAAALSSLFIGYSPNLVGSIAGAVWAFVAGLIGGALIARFYNYFLLRRTTRFHG